MVEIRWHSQTKGRSHSEHKLRPKPARQSSTLPMSGMWKRSHGRASEAPPNERGGNKICSAYRPRATSSTLPSARVPAAKAERPLSDQSKDRREDPGQWARRAGSGRSPREEQSVRQDPFRSLVVRVGSAAGGIVRECTERDGVERRRGLNP